MNRIRSYSALSALFLLLASGLLGCSKDKVSPLRIYVAAFLENLEVMPPNTRIYYDVFDLVVGTADLHVWTTTTGFGDEIQLSDNVPYSFILRKTVADGNFTESNVSYSGTIAKALFTKNDSSDPNQLKILVANSTPTLYLNGVKLPAPTPGTMPGGPTGGTATCPLGTWQTPTCNGAAGKFLVYNFGPGGVGYTENPDCNGICDKIKYNFDYQVSGNTITYNFTGSDPVVCNGTSQPGPVINTTTKYNITFTCGNNGNQLVTEASNTQTGVRTTLTFTRR